MQTLGKSSTRSIWLVASLGLALALPACGGDDDGGSGADSAAADAPGAVDGAGGTPDTAAAGVTVAFTANKSEIGGGGGGGGGGRDFRLTSVVVTGDFELGDPAAPGTADGHYHLYVDSVEPAGSYIHVDFEAYTTAAPSDPITWPADGAGAAAGAHTLILSLRNNDHSPVVPAVMTSIPMTVL